MRLIAHKHMLDKGDILLAVMTVSVYNHDSINCLLRKKANNHINVMVKKIRIMT